MSIQHAQLERLLEVKRYRELRELLQRAFAATPGDPDLHCLGARAAMGLADWDEAEQHMRAALAADPLHFGGRVLHFVISEHNKRYAEAERTITDLIREQPANASLIALYAELMMTTLHLGKARALAVEALRREPDHLRARIVHALLSVVEGDRAAADEQIAELMREDPEAVEVAVTLFRMLIEQRKYAQALEIGRELLRHDPRNAELAESLAELRAQTHWIAWPAYPLRRFGWLGSAGLWLLAIASVQLATRSGGVVLGGAIGAVYVAYAIYSWVYPPLLKRWLLRRGF